MTTRAIRPSLFLMSALLLLAIGASGARADGGVHLGTTTLLNSGPTAQKIDLVFLGDGFTAGEQDAFNARVDQAVTAFLTAHPIHALRSAFNIHRVNVGSPESGTDKFSTCGGKPTGEPNQQRRTAMDSGYCSGGVGTVNRCIFTSKSALALGFAKHAPQDDVRIVLVNDGGYGGCANMGLTFLTSTSQFPQITVHELGHALFDLADEYNYDGANNFSGPEPPRENVTINQNRATLKWGALVLGGTALPTQRQTNCADPALPGQNMDEDIVGLYEGGGTNRCGVFRPQYTCRMRENDHDFCAVCRRKIVRDLRTKLNDDLAVFFGSLLVKNDQDPWPRGEGEIYMDHYLRGNGLQVVGRWPAEGESDFDDGESQTLNTYAGAVPSPPAGTSATLEVHVHESDWPDGDDGLASDATQNLPGTGPFTIDRADYRLNGGVIPAGIRVLLDSINVKDDEDGWPAGVGDIYVEYTVTSGSLVAAGRWPDTGTVDMEDHETEMMGILAAVLPPPPIRDMPITIRVRVFDYDAWFTGADDLIGDNTFTFSIGEDFGADATTHVRDFGGYRITFTIAKRPR